MAIVTAQDATPARKGGGARCFVGDATVGVAIDTGRGFIGDPANGARDEVEPKVAELG